MQVFEFTEYKKFVLQELKKRPKKGHGEFLKIAKALGIHSTMVTHIFKGELNLSAEQCLALTDYLGLNDLETEFFLNLVHLARAGNERTRQYYQKKISALKDKAMNISIRLETKNSLSEEDQAVFYSGWIYTAIRLLSDIPRFQNRSAIATALALPASKVNAALEFLLSRGLCVEQGNKILYGEVNTYVGQDSPMVTRHHTNWRMKVLGQMDRLRGEDLAYTSPVVISEKDYLKIRGELVRFIERFNAMVAPSPCDNLYCLNIDWIHLVG